MNVNVMRAILGVALFISSPASFAQNKAKSETYKDIIEKAYNLSLQKDRQQALNILSSALLRETRPAAVAEIKKTALEISNVFFSDKAQQLFETGVSLRKSDVNQSLEKISEAVRIEPDNSQVINEQARLLIAKGDCKASWDTIQKQLLLVAHDEELKLTLAQSLVCQSRWIDYQKTLDLNQIKKSPLQKYWLLLEVERNLAAKNFVKAQEVLASAKKVDEKYPELLYWRWKLDQSQKRSNVIDSQKYVMTCKNISVNQYRQYMMDPMLCRRISEVESELKGTNGAIE